MRRIGCERGSVEFPAAEDDCRDVGERAIRSSLGVGDSVLVVHPYS